MPRQTKPTPSATAATVYVLRTKYIVMIEAITTDKVVAAAWEQSNDYRYSVPLIVDDPAALKAVKQLIKEAK